MSSMDSIDIQVSASASSANAELDELIVKLGVVQKSLSSIGGKSTNFGTKIKSQSNTATGELNKMSTSMNKATKSTTSLASAFGSLYANFFWVQRMFNGLWNSIDSTADYMESYNYFNVAFNKIANDWSGDFEKYGYENAESYAESFTDRMDKVFSKLSGIEFDNKNMRLASNEVKNLGLNIKEITQYAAQLGSVTNSVGLTGESSLAASSTFTKLAGDLSSLYNVDYSSVSTNLQSGLIGQSRALYKYGIDITNATLQTYAYELGLEKAVSEMTQAEKMQLRMIAILDQSRVAWGNLANEIDQPSNQIRIFKNNLSEAAQILGQLFMPILQKVMPVINGITIAVKNLLSNIAGIMGIELQFGSTQATDEMADSYEGVSDSIDGVADSAKKAKSYMLGIDELNVVETQTESGEASSSGSSGGIDLTQDILKAAEEYQKVWDEAYAQMESRAQAVADSLAGIFKPIEKLFKDIKIGDWFAVGEDTSNIVSGIFNFFSKAITDVDWYTVGNNMGLFLAGIDWTEIFASVGIAIWQGINGAIDLWSGLFDSAPLETTILTAFTFVPSIITGILKLITSLTPLITVGSNIIGVFELMKNAGMSLSAAMTTIFGTFATVFTGITSIITGASLAVTSFVSMFVNGFTWIKEILMVVGIGLTAVGAIILGAPAMWAGIVAGIVAGVATLVIVVKDNWDAIVEWTSNLFDSVGKFFEDLWTKICDIWSVVSDWFNDNVVTPIVNFFSPIVETVTTFFSEVWENIQSVWNTVATWFDENIITPIVDGFSIFVESVSTFFSDLWENIKTIWNVVSTWFSEKVIEPIVGFFVGFATRVGQVFQGLWIIVQAIWKIASTWFNENVIIPLKEKFINFTTKVKCVFEKLWSKVKEIWKAVSGWFKEKVITPIKDSFSNLKSTISSIFKGLWTGIKSTWKVVSDWFSEKIIDPLSDAFETACKNIEDFFSTLWSGIKSSVIGAMNAVIGGIEDGINYIIKGINSIISGFNKIVSWAAKVAEVDWGGVDEIKTVALTRIPAYEVGGFPEDGLFFANHTELVGKFSNGKTAVANNMQIIDGISYGVREAVSEVLAPYLADIAESNREVANKEFTTYIGDREIARANKRGQRSLGMQLITEY